MRMCCDLTALSRRRPCAELSCRQAQWTSMILECNLSVLVKRTSPLADHLQSNRVPVCYHDAAISVQTDGLLSPSLSSQHVLMRYLISRASRSAVVGPTASKMRETDHDRSSGVDSMTFSSYSALFWHHSTSTWTDITQVPLS